MRVSTVHYGCQPINIQSVDNQSPLINQISLAVHLTYVDIVGVNSPNSPCDERDFLFGRSPETRKRPIQLASSETFYE